MTNSTKLRLGHLSLAAAIVLLVGSIVGGWRADPEPKWIANALLLFWPVLLASFVFYAWARKGT